MQPQLRNGAGDRVEVAVVLQQAKAVLDRDARDQAIVAAARRFPGTPADLVEPRRGDVRLHRIRGEITPKIGEVAAPSVEALLGIGALENLLEDDGGGADDFLAREQFGERPDVRRLRTSQ